MYLFFDTETTGLPRDWKAPVTNLSNWPRLVQIAWLLYDKNGNLTLGKDYIIKPEGFLIPDEVTKMHGISTEKALREGINLKNVLTEFQTDMNAAEFLVAHNMSFDEKIVGAELIRSGLVNNIPLKKRICTKESTTNYCKIDGPYGYKWPKLSELHYKLFSCDFEEQHNAAVDITVTAKCFWELKKIGKI
jgi:DNA polymerase-3 subunit epsilon